MAKLIYDVIQRFEVENDVPRLISTNIQVIEGGEDLMSLATSMLAQLGFYDKFEENLTSQYIGYRFKKPGKGAKRYQLVLSQRKDGLCISISREILQPQILELKCYTSLSSSLIYTEDMEDEDYFSYEINSLAMLWVLPSQEDIFLATIRERYPSILRKGVSGSIFLNEYIDDGDIMLSISTEEFNLDLGNTDSYVLLNEDKLFPYTLQACISSKEILKEFISYFVKIILEQ